MFGASPTVTFTWSGVTRGKTATKSFKATRVKVITGTEITCDVKIPCDAVDGWYNITVKNADGQAGMLIRGFEVKPGLVPVAKPVIKELSKDHLLVGSPAFSLIITGRNFVTGSLTTNGSVIRWNGKTRVTSFLSGTRLKTGIQASDLSRVGRVNVSVFTYGVGNSNSIPFTIANPVPNLLQVSPTSVKAGTKTLTIALRGNNFVRESRVEWNGRYRQTQYLAPTMVNAKVLTTDLAQARKVNVTVVSPGPGGGGSNVAIFAVMK
jgi:hypothetical protein